MKTLLYSHDGRGAGHISRIVAISYGIKRNDPSHSVLCITGNNDFNVLNNNSEIDWVKVPSYKTLIKDGIIESKTNPLGLLSSELVKIRSNIMHAVAKSFVPDNLIVEYFPKGKNMELNDTITYLKKNTHCKIFLGLRGVIGDKNSKAYHDIFNKSNFSFIREFFDAIFVYTDQAIFDIKEEYLVNSFADRIIHTGYISRSFESDKLGIISGSKRVYDVIINLGCSINAYDIINLLLETKRSYFKKEQWAIFLGSSLSDLERRKIIEKSLKTESLEIKEFSYDFLSLLKTAKSVISHGGYNSIVDTLYFSKPTVYIARNVPEKDQEIHLKYLKKAGVITSFLLEYECTKPILFKAIKYCRIKKNSKRINLEGTETVAKLILEKSHDCRSKYK